MELAPNNLSYQCEDYNCPGNNCFTACKAYDEKGKLVGDAFFRKYKPYFPNKHDSCRITWIGVRKDYQRRGYGANLFKYITRIMGESGCEYAAWNSYPESVGFYEKLGAVFDNHSVPHREKAEMKIQLNPFPPNVFQGYGSFQPNLLSDWFC